jgi:exonuclease III
MDSQKVDCFDICTYNCNGIGDHKKRKDVFDYLRNLKSHIYFLQETHLLSTNENFIQSCWGYKAWVCGSDTNKNGVAILFNNNFDFNVFNVIKDPLGCYIAIDVEIMKKRVTLINVYGPSSGDNADFFVKVEDCIQQIGNDLIILAGDWNCVLNRNMDVRNYFGVEHRPKTRKKILDIIDNNDLCDIYREIHPIKKSYTWRKFKTSKQSRLDYFLISNALIPEVKDVRVVSGYRSDHSPVLLSLKREQFKKDRPFWKFNNSLLKDKEYLEEIKAIITKIKRQYATPVYNFEKIDEINNKELQFIIEDQLFFEMLLLEIRGKTISYSTYKKKKEKEEEVILHNKLIELEKDINEESVKEIEKVKCQLQEYRSKKLDGMIIRSRARWLIDGEKCSNYFCSMERRNFTDKSMCFLQKDDGNILSEQTDILKEVKNFYQDLYNIRQVKEIDLHQKLTDAPNLTDNERNSIEGMIQMEELVHALKNMKNNKSPGSDGFTVEFYKFFIRDIGDFLLRSINCSFDKGQMSVTQRQGIITCIPKEGKERQLLKNWRPISLLNVAYKIASACISNRLKKVLPNIIHESQTGFLKGRYIGNNVRLLYDTIVYTEKQNIPGMLLSIDFEKAFDSVSWQFLEKCLAFFGFGPDLIKWIKIFYNDINACVLVNGQYSSWFPILRGVRQGDPLSPYLYLVCAEVLSLYIRKNDLIRGIKLREKEALLSQFADDTTLLLDGSEQSFQEAIKILKQFSEISGLKMNLEKTQVIWIGSRKNSNIRYMRDENFVWNPGTFKILGIKFSVESENIANINYEDKLLVIKKALRYWKKRQLTPLGKIVVLKTLIVSKITHLLINLPDPTYEFLVALDIEFHNFLWDNKRYKIKKSVTSGKYEEGGLKMLDIFSFLSSMKITWLRKLQCDSEWRNFTYDIYPILVPLEKLGSEYAHVAMQKVDNLFWKDVLKHYKKLYMKCLPTSIHDFAGECIHYNINILRDNKVVFLKEWCDASIIYVRQLINNEGMFMNYNEFLVRYPMIQRTSFLVYHGILRAVTHYLKKMNLNLANKLKLLKTKTWHIIGKGNKHVQSMLSRTGTTPAAVKKWDAEYNNLNWKIIFNFCFATTLDVQLRWFQLRLLHRILPTEKYLYTCKIKNDPMCNFCNAEIQTLEHLFWDCDKVQKFWKNCQRALQSKCTHCYQLNFNKELILFGNSENIATDNTLDLIIIMAKFYVYKCKIQNCTPQLLTFCNILKSRYQTELYCATISGNKILCTQQWIHYKAFFDDC